MENPVKMRACFLLRFRKPSEGYLATKMLPKTCSETIASHLQRGHPYMHIFVQEIHGENELEPVYARYRKVRFLLLFTVVLKTLAFARKRENSDPKPTKP